jgi:hypothetical protein
MESLIEVLPDVFRTGAAALLIIVALSWTAFWTILALYRAASRKQKIWFVVLFFVNTIGILEIIYLLVYSGKPKRA